ncbi:lysophospholipid acyltransferase family protein [Celeribacter indicus]|uniref:Phospholipid/glycerol acyltransferase n=1 Tax=Celeribacter indicus TaxID=1208324 RepID=A0A0B5E7C1_9RHOB|nr:1-acyl-sn-glycerol-3-phosphate acyltransferase [Celeribacter indicus]AJE48961.1 phospholipid/glycerol acyltransferase [Celeribacter indicus]SDW42374.1 1-acyl-sn-glycerol-3-phosphate acyltransferase [Celeribacter indicus]
MPYPVQWLLSLIFIIQMYLAMAVCALIFTPFVLVRRDMAFVAVHSYCRWVRFSARVIVGLRSEVRGEVPADEVLVASKHQSFFDIILLCGALPRPKFIMKKQLVWAPIVGFYARKIGCIPVDRGKRGQAIKRMIADVKSGAAMPGQLIIFPQGTRVAAGAKMPYKIGTGVLYEQTGQDIVPAATNVGVFWRRKGIYRGRGTAVLEFLPRIPAGRNMKEVMAGLEEMVETASDRLMDEAGFTFPPTA